MTRTLLALIVLLIAVPNAALAGPIGALEPVNDVLEQTTSTLDEVVSSSITYEEPSVTPVAVPEPGSTLLLFGIGALGLGLARRRLR